MREKKCFIWITLLAIVVVLNLPLSMSMRIKAGSRDNIAAPFQNVMSLLLNKGREVILFLGKAREAVGEKERMLELAVLRERIRSLEAIERENEDLRNLFNFSSRSECKLVLGEVIARGDISGWWQTITLNKGTDSGIARNMAVITMEGLIGRTMDVSRRTCDVLLISDPSCKVACRISRTEAVGIVRGTGISAKGDTRLEMLSSLGHWRMEYISMDEEVRIHDKVVTSGFGRVYPEGLLVGYVTKKDVDPSGLYQSAEIVPAAEMRTLRYVFVVVK